jgi:excisionase family DNA binding protein
MYSEQHFLTVDELAAYLRVSRRTAYQLVTDANVPRIRVGGSWRIPRAELERQLAASTSGTLADTMASAP